MLALVSLLAFAGHARAAEPGVVSLVNGNAFQRIQSSGAKHVRLFVSWRGMEPRPGNLDPATLGAYDDLINRLRGIGVNVYFVVVQTPAWASSSGAVDAPPPAALFADFMRRLAAHFQGRVLAYEVWNEPDYPVFWQGSAPPVVYAALLRAAYVAIKAGDPAAKVGVGGLVGNDYAYLDQLYLAGARGSFDFVGVHTDTDCQRADPRQAFRDVDGRVSRWVFTGYREVRQTMLDHGDPKPIWMTELGWSTTSLRCPVNRRAPAGVSPATQAAFLSRAYACLAADPYVQMATWFSLTDFPGPDSIGTRFGLINSSGAPRPAFAAFRRARSVAPDRSCGLPVDTGGPALNVVAPRNGSTRSGDLFYRATASDPGGLRNLQFLVDGQVIRRTAKHTLRGLWHGWRRLSYGQHTVTFRAVDRALNVSTRSLVVTKVPYGLGEAIRTRIALKLYGTGRTRLAGAQLYTLPHAARSLAHGPLTLGWERRAGSRWLPLPGVAAGSVSHGVRSRRRFGPGLYRAVARYGGYRSFRPAVAVKTFRVG